ncbi:hypothetical protein M2D63_022850 [Pseudomonas sp. BJa5]|uniref:hypothetical protein n=1 Tax=Pseudomonas sp. BJa5 TaxID=2936270 RepID=UPI00255A0E14|nr:hypothetical protein [Pseudomonas sp. BGr12]MDL2423959.1 DKNYY domain-containing protein [Pseudomonas sp. BGr12]
MQIHNTYETRKFWLVSRDGANFRMAPATPAVLTPSQLDELSRYAVDRTAAYYNSDRIEGAAPATFEVFFPTGTAEHWKNYSFARDAHHLFINGWPLPFFELSQATRLALSCADDESFTCRDRASRQPLLIKVGDDLLFLDGSRPTLFKGLAKPDLACSLHGFKAYCTSGGQHYRIEPGITKQARLMPQDKYGIADNESPE